MRVFNRKYYLVYKITNIVNQKIYIGFHCTDDINDNYMGSGRNIKFAIKKYGIENFKKEILKVFDNQNDAEQYERELVNEDFVKRTDTYNISLGGNVCILYGEDNGFYGKHHSEETKEKVRESKKNSIVTSETKQKISKKLKESWTNEEYKEKMIEIRRNAWKRDGYKEKMIEARKNQWKDKERKEKTLKKIIAKTRSRSKTYIVLYPDGKEEIVKGISCWCDKHNLNRSHLMDTLKGIRNHHKGYKIKQVIKE